MAQPRRRYYIALSREMGMTVDTMLRSMSSADISEQMAYDALKDEDYRKKLENERERVESQELTPEERAARFKQMLRGK